MITVSFAYSNHRGVTEARTVDVLTIDFLCKPGFGYQPGWFLTGYCHDRKAVRSFALTHIVLPPDTHHRNVGMRIVIDRLTVEELNMPTLEHPHGNEDQGNTGTSETERPAPSVGDT